MTAAVVLNWNEFDTSLESVRLLVLDKDVQKVVFVDNGSDVRDWRRHRDNNFYLGNFNKLIDAKQLDYVRLENNLGPSIARNMGIEAITRVWDGQSNTVPDHIFLIDGDIKYVPGTVAAYQEVMERIAVRDKTPIGCVGYYNLQQVQATGTNGVLIPDQAQDHIPNLLNVYEYFPIAWTQYGLFDGPMLAEIGFNEDGVYGEAGYGYEDDWLFKEMQELGYRSISVDQPWYYHNAHSGKRQLGNQTKENERRNLFIKKWGHNGWMQTLRKNYPDGNYPGPIAVVEI